MKKLILILFFCSPFLGNAQTIKDYYELFVHQYRKPLQNSATNQVTIDEKKAFIQIKNPLMAGDAVSFVYFVKKDNTKIFGFQYVSAMVDMVLAVPRTEFYKYEGNKWVDVTYEVRPNLELKDFWGKQPLPPKSMQEFNLELILPQMGTTVLANISPAHSFQFAYNNKPEDYDKTFAKCQYKTIELNWNKTTGKFEKGKKY
jgi:hypothetical protein